MPKHQAQLEGHVRDYSSLGVNPGGGSSTDSTAGIRAAVIAAHNAAAAATAASGFRAEFRLIFGPGTYLTDNIMPTGNTPVRNVIFEFNGATLAKKSDSDLSVGKGALIAVPEFATSGNRYGNYQNLTFRGGIIEPNGKTSNGTMFRMNWQEDFLVEHMTFTSFGPPHAGLGLNGTYAIHYSGRNTTIQYNTILGGDVYHEDGIHMMFGSNGRIHGNYIESGDDAIALAPVISSTMGNELQAEPIDGVTVTANTVKARQGHALRLYAPLLTAGAITNGNTADEYGVRNVTCNGLVGTAGVTRNGGVMIDDNNFGAVGAENIRGIKISGVALDCGSTTHDGTNPYGFSCRSATDVTFEGRISSIDKTAASAAEAFRRVYIRDSQDVDVHINGTPVQQSHAVEFRASRRVKASGGARQSATANIAAVLIRDTTDATISMNITDVQDGLLGIDLSGITSPQNTVTIDGTTVAHAAGATTGAAIRASATQTARLDILNSDFSGAVQPLDYATYANFRLIPKLSVTGTRGFPERFVKQRDSDEFLGTYLSDQWDVKTGTDPEIALAMGTGIGGDATITLGNDAAGTMALNGIQVSRGLYCQANKSGLSLRWSFNVATATTFLNIFAGFTDQLAVLEAPFTLGASDALTSNASNAVGWLFDTAADTDNWWLVGVKADADATKQNTGAAMLTGRHVYGVDIDSSGQARFYLDEKQVGVLMTNAITASVPLTPAFIAFNRSTGVRTILLDYYELEQNR